MNSGYIVEIHVTNHPIGYGRYERTRRDGLIVVTPFSPRLGRYIKTSKVYHPKFIRPLGVTA